MGIRESIKGRCYRGNTDSDHSSSQQLENSPAAITPTNEEVIVGPSEKTSTSLLSSEAVAPNVANHKRVLIMRTPHSLDVGSGGNSILVYRVQNYKIKHITH
jgi:hypothetical protein